MNYDHALTLPLSVRDLAGLKPGETCLLSGPLYTLRDAGHLRLLQELEASAGERNAIGASAAQPLPYGLAGQTIFYAGPTPAPTSPQAAATGRPFGAIGPTTASRMDFAAPALYDAGVVATIGKGTRSDAVAQACARNGAVYFTAVGGAAALLAQCVESCETIAYGDLGTEALRRLMVRDLPVTVAIDAHGEGAAAQVRGAQPQGVPAAESAAPANGAFITFEGGDGAGKSTMVRLLAAALREEGANVLCLREPGGTRIGEKLRAILLDPENDELDARAELLLYEAARAQIVAQVIKPALEAGTVVLCDRFTDSTMAYQAAGRGLAREDVAAANAFACAGIAPVRTIVLTCGQAGEGLARAAKRGEVDRIEQAGLSFHARVNGEFARLAASGDARIRTVASQPRKHQTLAAVIDALRDLFPQLACPSAEWVERQEAERKRAQVPAEAGQKPDSPAPGSGEGGA